MIPLAKPFLNQAEESAIKKVLESRYLVQGPRVAEFENLVAKRTGRKHAIAVTNGTTALLLSLKALGISFGDEVLCPAMTWPSPAHAIRLLGAKPVLVDIDIDEWNSTEETLKEIDLSNVKAAIMIDQFGNPLRHQAIKKILKDIPIIEDAACSLGSCFSNHDECGSFGQLSTISFHPRKIITTGEGGMILTDDDEFLPTLYALRNHGQIESGNFQIPGGNNRLSEIAAAMGIEQMKKLDSIIEKRRKQMEKYIGFFEEQNLSYQKENEGAFSTYQTIGMVLPKDVEYDVFFEKMKSHGVQIGKLSFDLSTLKSIDSKREFPNSSLIAIQGVTIPAFHEMTEKEHDQILFALKEAIQ